MQTYGQMIHAVPVQQSRTPAYLQLVSIFATVFAAVFCLGYALSPNSAPVQHYVMTAPSQTIAAPRTLTKLPKLPRTAAQQIPSTGHVGAVRLHATGTEEVRRDTTIPRPPVDPKKTVLIGVAADSGCGKSTFMRRLTGIFGGGSPTPLGGGFSAGSWETNTLVSEKTTVMCLDDYHLNDRAGRKVTGLTALDERENNFDLMFEQMSALRRGEKISKPIYNHVNGTLDTPEEIAPSPIMIIEGLHPMLDDRVAGLLDFSIYLDISDRVKFAWKIQRDMAERGWALEDIKADIEKRKPDFDKYVAPQKAKADMVIEVLPSQIAPPKDENAPCDYLRVRLIQKTDTKFFDPVYLVEKGSTINWKPCGDSLQCEFPGVQFQYYPETYMGNSVEVLEMDGVIHNMKEGLYVEKFLHNTATKEFGEMTKLLLEAINAPGGDNGTGFMQTLAALKIREIYERATGETV
jgi:phosphoribulokinase|mmetsp:Transcript_5900/g.10810  ORF Transcript_5900/g.10810 Transcript_5900/m.10810 type:complete len:462 (-) Transcript_5900:634-2019(-)